MTSLSAFSVRRRYWALVLSILALCSALLAPASVLAQGISAGKWSALCGTGGTAPAQDHGQDEGHCDLCLLPGPALPAGAQPLGLPPAPLSAPQASLGAAGQAAQSAGPFIRGPPRSFFGA
ncbi:MAG: hypothetical protein WCK08_11190 [Betaproteobacteria bacterium]